MHSFVDYIEQGIWLAQKIIAAAKRGGKQAQRN